MKIEVDFKNLSPKKIKRAAKRLETEIPKASLKGLRKTETRIKKELRKYTKNIRVPITVRTETPGVTAVSSTPAPDAEVLATLRGSKLSRLQKEWDVEDIERSKAMSFIEGTRASAKPKGTGQPNARTRYAVIKIPHEGNLTARDAHFRVKNAMKGGMIFFDPIDQQYFYLNSNDIEKLSKFIKIKCSDESGLDNSGNAHDKTNQRYSREVESKPIGRQESTFTIKNDGIQAIVNGEIGTNITEAVHAEQRGDPDGAAEIIRNKNISSESAPIQRLNEAGRELAQNPYSMLRSFINGLHWEQTSFKRGSREAVSKFSLSSSYGANLKDIEAAIDSANAQNDKVAKFYRQTSEAIQNINSALMVAKDTYVPEKAVEQITISVQKVMKSLES
jgi:hypothetical protein